MQEHSGASCSRHPRLMAGQLASSYSCSIRQEPLPRFCWCAPLQRCPNALQLMAAEPRLQFRECERCTNRGHLVRSWGGRNESVALLNRRQEEERRAKTDKKTEWGKGCTAHAAGADTCGAPARCTGKEAGRPVNGHERQGLPIHLAAHSLAVIWLGYRTAVQGAPASAERRPAAHCPAAQPCFCCHCCASRASRAATSRSHSSTLVALGLP